METLHEKISQLLPDRPALIVDETTLSSVAIGMAGVVLEKYNGLEDKITESKDFFFRVVSVGTVADPKSFKQIGRAHV